MSPRKGCTMASDGSLSLDASQARRIGTLLDTAYRDDGILGSGTPPDRRVPKGMDRGDRQHLHFVTLTSAINYHRDRWELWSAARETAADAATRFVFDPAEAVAAGQEKVQAALQVHGLSGKPTKDADIWFRICATLVEHFDGSVWSLLEEADFDVTAALDTVRAGTYDFPYLGGTKIGSLWAHNLAATWGGHALGGMQAIPLYVDRDVAAAAVTGGAVGGPYDGPYSALKSAVEEVVTEACAGTDLYPMQFYAPMSELGSRGCQNVETWPCPVRRDCPVMIFCVETRPRKSANGVTFGGPRRVGTAISL